MIRQHTLLVRLDNNLLSHPCHLLLQAPSSAAQIRSDQEHHRFEVLGIRRVIAQMPPTLQ